MRATPSLKALLLILMALFFAAILVDGKLYYYIGPRFAWLALVAVCLFILLAGAYNLVRRGNDHSGHDDHPHDHEHAPDTQESIWPVLITAIPLILAVVVPAKPLGADAIASRGVSTGFAGRGSTAITVDPSARTVLDWAQAISATSDPSALDGQQADAIGFVYRDPRFGRNQFMLTRFAITCCVADALAIGVVVQSEKSPQLQADSWVHVKGPFKSGQLDGQSMPVLMAVEVSPIQPPDQPYLYP